MHALQAWSAANSIDAYDELIIQDRHIPNIVPDDQSIPVCRAGEVTMVIIDSEMYVHDIVVSLVSPDD